ncbi:MAG TPA: acyltransferase [Caulobacterales bacterium]|nr:acyltransferase [Caulobacterales bacterium]
MPRFAAIEGLRAWLAWAVVFSHLAQTLSMEALGGHWKLMEDGGEVAVYVFIVISGFVITGLVVDKQESWPRYILRRAFRIFPAYWVAWALALAVLPFALAALAHEPWLAAPGATYDDLLRGWNGAMRAHALPEHLLHATLLSGVVADSVWPYAANAVLGPAWSLTLEWQFYLVAPLLIWLLRSKHGRLPAVLAIALGAYGFQEQWFGHYNLPTFLPGAAYVFLIGIASRLGFAELKRVPVPAAFVFGALIVGVIYREIMWLAVWCAMLAFLLRGAEWRAATGAVMRAAFESAPARYFGACSYSVYLLHLPIMQFATWIITTRFAPDQMHAFLYVTAATVPATLILSDALYRAVERPMIGLGARLARSEPKTAEVAQAA